MRGWMLGKVGLTVAATASVVLLASCLVSSKDKKPPHQITSLTLPNYASGDYISMLYVDPYLVNNTPQIPSSGIQLSWELASLSDPFTPTFRTLLRFNFQDASGSAVQYVTQDSKGSIFLHAFGGVNAQNSFWPDVEGQLNSPDTPQPMQVFWSPLGGSTNYAEGSNMDFHVMGECNNGVCTSLADFIFNEHKVIDPGAAKEVISTPLGDFETFHLHYEGTMNARDMQTTPPHFDYRVSCWTPGIAGPVTFVGDVWIYPPIGPVQIANSCTAASNGAFQNIRYTAQITGTNLPF